MSKSKNIFISITLTKEIPISIPYSTEEKEEMDKIMTEEIKKLISDPAFNEFEIDSVMYEEV